MGIKFKKRSMNLKFILFIVLILMLFSLFSIKKNMLTGNIVKGLSLNKNKNLLNAREKYYNNNDYEKTILS